MLTRAAVELRPGELGLAALVRRIAGGEELVLNAALAIVIYAVGAAAVLIRTRMFTTRVVDASTWSLLAAPHALLHDGVMAYPAVARAATTTSATALWVGSGIADPAGRNPAGAAMAARNLDKGRRRCSVPAGGTGERVAREPLTGRVGGARARREGSGPVGERATPTPLRGQGPLPLGQDPPGPAGQD